MNHSLKKSKYGGNQMKQMLISKQNQHTNKLFINGISNLISISFEFH